MTIENLVYNNSLEIKADEPNNTLHIVLRGERGLQKINNLEYKAEDGDELGRVLDLLKATFATVEIEYINE